VNGWFAYFLEHPLRVVLCDVVEQLDVPVAIPIYWYCAQAAIYHKLSFQVFKPIREPFLEPFCRFQRVLVPELNMAMETE
jgi:hypothetical protein